MSRIYIDIEERVNNVFGGDRFVVCLVGIFVDLGIMTSLFSHIASKQRPVTRGPEYVLELACGARIILLESRDNIVLPETELCIQKWFSYPVDQRTTAGTGSN